jgi:hypothetical protein
MSITYRPARAEDLEKAEALVVSSINDLTQRHGFGTIAQVSPPLFQAFSLRDDPDGLWVAEKADEVLGFAFSWVCGDLWFLAQLFVAPTAQKLGIGHELMRHALGHARLNDARNKALITFAFNTASQGLYIRHGLYPRWPLYMMRVGLDSVRGGQAEARFRSEPLDDSTAMLERLARIDASALGTSRAKHHRYLIGTGGVEGISLWEKNECVGYAYVSRDGHLGPIAVSDGRLLSTAFRTAVEQAARHSPKQVSALVPGGNPAALRAATAHGMRITLPMLLMSTEPLGNWSQYLPRNPGFM